jgi:hypothetical protein
MKPVEIVLREEGGGGGGRTIERMHLIRIY